MHGIAVSSAVSAIITQPSRCQGDIGPKKALPPPQKPKDPKAIWDDDEVGRLHLCKCSLACMPTPKKAGVQAVHQRTRARRLR